MGLTSWEGQKINLLSKMATTKTKKMNSALETQFYFFIVLPLSGRFCIAVASPLQKALTLTGSTIFGIFLVALLLWFENRFIELRSPTSKIICGVSVSSQIAADGENAIGSDSRFWKPKFGSFGTLAFLTFSKTSSSSAEVSFPVTEWGHCLVTYRY